MKMFCCVLVLVLASPFLAFGQSDRDIQEIKDTLDSWNRGWAEKNVELAVQDYSNDVDWTNAFGDRFENRKDLKKGLEFIFGLEFVMAGSSGNNEYEDVRFLGENVALLRSKLNRKGQKNAQGNVMPDRHIHHLRVYKRIDGKWKIVSHMISQAQPKTLPKGQRKK